MRTMLRTIILFVACISFSSDAGANDRCRFAHDVNLASDGSQFEAVIEIPAQTAVKYEIDPATNRIVADRFMAMAVSYPANYGFIPNTLAGDGDALDVLVLTRMPLVPGAYIEVRPIGVMYAIDGDEQDDKVIAVPSSIVDASFDEIRSIDDLPIQERQRLEAFFDVYKRLPEGSKVMEVTGWGGPDEAVTSVREALAACR
jgi:inorganic pyrophosphatase